jgi:N-acetylmuramoyl-L-alanine amidase
MRAIFCSLLILFWLSVVGEAAFAKPNVSDVRIGVHPDKTRFVMELSEQPAYRVFTLPDPYRVVIDLPELDWRLPIGVQRKSGGVIENLRFGLFAPGASRVVLDLRAPVRVGKVFVLPPTAGYPYRLVIDLVQVSRQAFMHRPQSPVESAERLPAPKPRSSPSRAQADDCITVVIDPGHGGVDPGAIGISGIYEKAVTLAYATELKRQLETTGRYCVTLTRDRDIFVRLADRSGLARKLGAELFLSIHADAHRSRKLHGAAVYTLSEKASDSVAATLAESANKGDLIAGVDLTNQSDDVAMILLDLTQRETMNLSARYASSLVDELGEETKLLNRTHRFAGFVVLTAHDVPSVLVELGFLSNRQDEKRLRSPRHRQRLVGAIVRAVERYFDWQRNSR